MRRKRRAFPDEERHRAFHSTDRRGCRRCRHGLRRCARHRSEPCAQSRRDLRELPRPRRREPGRNGEPCRHEQRPTSSARCGSSRPASKPATMMQQLAKGYTDEQIELIAGWFAAQKAAEVSGPAEEMTMRRREFLKAAAAGSASSALPACATIGGVRPARSSSSAAATAARRPPSTSGCGATARSTSPWSSRTPSSFPARCRTSCWAEARISRS